jgi:ATP-dependent RNA helicase DDX5/DBP2
MTVDIYILLLLSVDVKNVEMVINFDFPNGVEDYIHRIGRTGRAGAKGVSFTMFTQKNAGKAMDLVKLLREAGQEIPPELDDMARRAPIGGGGSRYGGGGFRGRGRY